MKKIIYILIFIVAFTNNSFAAATDSNSSDGSSSYTKAYNLIKQAKNRIMPALLIVPGISILYFQI